MPGFSVQEVSEVRRLYDAGTSIAQLKVRTGRSMETVWRALQASGGTGTSSEGVALVRGQGRGGEPLLALGKDEDLCSKVASLPTWLHGNSSPDLRADRKFSIFEDL